MMFLSFTNTIQDCDHLRVQSFIKKIKWKYFSKGSSLESRPLCLDYYLVLISSSYFVGWVCTSLDFFYSGLALSSSSNSFWYSSRSTSSSAGYLYYSLAFFSDLNKKKESHFSFQAINIGLLLYLWRICYISPRTAIFLPSSFLRNIFLFSLIWWCVWIVALWVRLLLVKYGWSFQLFRLSK